MQITSLRTYPKPITQKKIQNLSIKTSNSPKQANYTNSTLLSDANYGSLLVNKQTPGVAFKGTEKVGKLVPEIIKKIPFEERLASIVEIIGNNDIIVAAKNKVIANKFLNESKSAFDNVIKRVFFVPEEKIPEAFAITRTELAPGIINLGEKPILVSNLEGKNFMVGKSMGVWTRPEATIHLNDSFSFSVKEQSTENLSMMRSEFAEPFNFTQEVQESIENINKKTFKNLFLEETQKKRQGLSDVGGMDEVVKELKKGVLYPIKYPEVYANRKLNHGYILYGPPGTGKTFVAKCLANDAGASYYEVNAGSLRAGLVGQTEANWRKLVQDAVDNQPSIILVDECDAVFKARSPLQPYAADELNQILSLISDIEKNNDNVFIISTTNKPELLDEAILRAGRLGKQICVPAPDLKGLKDIISKQLKDYSIDEKFSVDKLAEKIHKHNLTGADTNQIADNAYDIAFERLGFFEKMEAGIKITSEMKKNIKLTQDDFDKGLEKYLEQNIKAAGKTKRKPVGFKPQNNALPSVEYKNQQYTDGQVAAMG